MAFSRFCLAVIVLFCSTSTLRAVNGLSLQIPQDQMRQVLPLGTNATVQCLHQSNETRPNISWTIDNSLPYDTYTSYFNQNGIKVNMDSDNISFVSVEGRQENVVPGGRRFSCNAINPVNNVPVASETASVTYSQCFVSEPTISLGDVCAVVSQESLTYSCNNEGNVVRWSSSLWPSQIIASAGSTPSIPSLAVSGVTLVESDNGDSSCLVSNLTFNGTLSALEALNGATLNCDAHEKPPDSITIVIPTLPGISSLKNVPSSLSCDGDSNMAVTLQWTPPTNTGGQGVMITHYVLTGLPQSASCSTGPCDNITSTTTTITGLQCNTSYNVSVRAVNCRGIGASSNVIEIIFYPAPITQVSISSSSVLSSLSLTKTSYTQLPSVSPSVVAQQQDCSQLGLIVGIPVAFLLTLLTAIISSLITLLITFLIMRRRESHDKFTPSPPVSVSGTRPGDAVEMKSNEAYGTTGLGGGGADMTYETVPL